MTIKPCERCCGFFRITKRHLPIRPHELSLQWGLRIGLPLMKARWAA